LYVYQRVTSLYRPPLGPRNVTSAQVITSAADPAPSQQVISELADAYAVAELSPGDGEILGENEG
jgi:hypothetical protein